jgi:16S rRNA (cytidine1402-2'-O)-methyltransferase
MDKINASKEDLIQEVSSFSNEQRDYGTLYLVSTPIGNLDDMTFRAIDTLRNVDIIAAEDTRQTMKLLNYFEINGPKLISYHEYNKVEQAKECMRSLLNGLSIAIVTDAGTPGISDPGSDLVKWASEQAVPVVSVPGACAAITALVASGLPTQPFTFIGFLPREKKERSEVLEYYRARNETLIFYESPYRIQNLVEHLAELYPQRHVVLARELTKRYEAYTRGKTTDVKRWLEQQNPRGEYVVILSGASDEELEEKLEEDQWWRSLSLSKHVDVLVEKGDDKKEAMKKVARLRGISKREVYQALLAEEQQK